MNSGPATWRPALAPRVGDAGSQRRRRYAPAQSKYASRAASARPDRPSRPSSRRCSARAIRVAARSAAGSRSDVQPGDPLPVLRRVGGWTSRRTPDAQPIDWGCRHVRCDSPQAARCRSTCHRSPGRLRIYFQAGHDLHDAGPDQGSAGRPLDCRRCASGASPRRPPAPHAGTAYLPGGQAARRRRALEPPSTPLSGCA